MPLEVAIPLALSCLGALVVAVRSVVNNGTKAVVLLTQLKEQVNLSLVGIQALRMVDTETENRTRLNEQRIEDIERYLQLASNGNYPHPFQLRSALRNSSSNEQ